MGAANNLTPEQAEAIGNSNYLTNSDISDLLGNVQTVTSAAAEFLGNIVKTEAGYLTALNVALGDAYMSAAKQAGLVTENADGTYAMSNGMYEDDKLTTEAQNQFSNLMVMSVAKEMENMTEQELINTVINVSNPAGSVSGKGSVGNQLAVTYSMILAYELSNGAEYSDDFNTLNDSLHSGSLSEIQGAFQTYLASSKQGNNGFLSYAVNFDNNGNPTELKDAAKTDFTALTSIMSGVGAVSEKYTDKDMLANAELMTSGDVANDVNTFVGAAAMKANGVTLNLTGEGVFVYFAPDAKKMFIVGSSVG